MSLRFKAFVAAAFAVCLSVAVVTGVAAQEKQKPAVGDKPAASFSPEQKRAIEGIIRDFLIENPEVIIESVRALQEREKMESRERAQDNLKTSKEALLNDPDTPVGGNLKGDVTIVEFFDYRCGYCKRVMPSLVAVVKADKNIRMVYKEFPILGAESVVAAKAALAAWQIDKGKYETFHVQIMKATGALQESRLMKIAADVGLDVKALKKAMADPRLEAHINMNYALAEALDIKGTPGFVIGDQIVRGAIDVDTLKQLVARARGS